MPRVQRTEKTPANQLKYRNDILIVWQNWTWVKSHLYSWAVGDKRRDLKDLSFVFKICLYKLQCLRLTVIFSELLALRYSLSRVVEDVLLCDISNSPMGTSEMFKFLVFQVSCKHRLVIPKPSMWFKPNCLYCVASLYIPSRMPDVDTLQLEEIKVKPSQAVSSGTRGSDQTIVEYFLALTVWSWIKDF